MYWVVRQDNIISRLILLYRTDLVTTLRYFEIRNLCHKVYGKNRVQNLKCLSHAFLVKVKTFEENDKKPSLNHGHLAQQRTIQRFKKEIETKKKSFH